MDITPPHGRTSYNLFFLEMVVEKDGCGSEFIVGSFENRICMCGLVMSNFGVDFARNVRYN